MKRTVRADFGEVSMREGGTISARLFPGSVIGLEEAKQYLELVGYLTKHQKHVTVIDLSGVKSISLKARNYLQNNAVETQNTVAVAMITNSFISRMFGSLFLTVNRPPCHVKIFRDPVNAHFWAQTKYQQAVAKTAS